MKKIAVWNLKGGVGKTTVSHILYKYLGLPIYTNDTSCLLYTNSVAKLPKYRKESDSYIIDLRGSATSQLHSIFKDIDIFIVPTKLNKVDVQDTMNTLRILSEFKKQIIVVFNDFEKSDAEDKRQKEVEYDLREIVDFTSFIFVKSKNTAKILDYNLTLEELEANRLSTSFKKSMDAVAALLKVVENTKGY